MQLRLETYSRYSGSLKYGHLDLVWHGLLATCRCLLHKTHPEMRPPRYSVYWSVLAAPNQIFNVRLLRPDIYYVLGVVLADKIGLHLNLNREHIMTHYPRDKTAKLV